MPRRILKELEKVLLPCMQDFDANYYSASASSSSTKKKTRAKKTVTTTKPIVVEDGEEMEPWWTRDVKMMAMGKYNHIQVMMAQVKLEIARRNAVGPFSEHSGIKFDEVGSNESTNGSGCSDEEDLTLKRKRIPVESLDISDGQWCVQPFPIEYEKEKLLQVGLGVGTYHSNYLPVMHRISYRFVFLFASDLGERYNRSTRSPPGFCQCLYLS